jgi:hypothetical protein
MDAILQIADIKSSVAQVAKAYDVKKVTLFGSYATGKRNRHSDIDLLVEFGPRPTSLYKIAGFKLRLEDLIGKAVDVIPTPLPPNSLIEIDKEVLLYETQG